MAPQPRIFRPRPSASDEKILGFGAISLYIALKNLIYTLHIHIYIIYILYPVTKKLSDAKVK